MLKYPAMVQAAKAARLRVQHTNHGAYSITGKTYRVKVTALGFITASQIGVRNSATMGITEARARRLLDL